MVAFAAVWLRSRRLDAAPVGARFAPDRASEQPQFPPLKMEEQGCVIWAGTNGFLDGIPLPRCRLEDGLLSLLPARTSISSTPSATAAISATIPHQLKTVVEGYTKTLLNLTWRKPSFVTSTLAGGRRRSRSGGSEQQALRLLLTPPPNLPARGGGNAVKLKDKFTQWPA